MEVWQRHCYSEFVMKDAKGALATMSDNPYVLMVPIATPGSLSRSARSPSLSLKTESQRNTCIGIRRAYWNSWGLMFTDSLRSALETGRKQGGTNARSND